MKQQLKFLIVDDQRIIRESFSEKLKYLFTNAEIKQAGSAKDCLDLIEDFSPDIIFMDISMPDMDGIHATRLVLSAFPKQKIIAFSMNDNDEMLNKMLKAGAKGYLLKTDDEEDCQVAVDSVMSGQLFISRNVTK